MAEVDYPKFSVGNELYALFSGVKLNSRIADHHVRAGLAAEKPAFNVKGSIVRELSNGGFIIAHLLSESHIVLHYDAQAMQLFAALYTCRNEFDGRKTFSVLEQKLRTAPSWIKECPAIVNKDLSLARNEVAYNSVDEAIDSLNIKPNSRIYIATVMYDLPKEHWYDKRLENILTKASTECDVLPDTELWQRFKPACMKDAQGKPIKPKDPLGFSVLYVTDKKENPENYAELPSDAIVIGDHTFEEHDSLHSGGYGISDELIPRIKLLGKLAKPGRVVARLPYDANVFKQPALK